MEITNELAHAFDKEKFKHSPSFYLINELQESVKLWRNLDLQKSKQ